MVNKYLVLSLLSILVTTCSGDKYGNILDTSWELPEPQGVPKSACERDIQKVYMNLRNMTLWAYEMWDASSRTPGGVLEGNQYHFGNWDECVGKVRPPDGSQGIPRQYCMVMTYVKPVPLTQYSTAVTPLDSAYNKLYRPHNFALVSRNIAFWGICTPASCQPPELSGMLQDHFHNESVRIADSNKQPLAAPRPANASADVRHEVQALLMPWGCQKPDDPVEVTYGAIGFFIMVGLTTTAVVVATWYHWYIRRLTNNKDCECPPLVTTFSLFVSVKKLGQKEKTVELRILNGLRVASILIVIFGHRFGGTFSGPVINRNYLEEMHMRFPSIFVSFGDLVVDTFLLLSGLVLGYRLLKVNAKTPLNMPLLILHRYLRLIPAFAVMIAFIGHVLPLLGSGPLWPPVVGPEVAACRQNWWVNLLMLNNYINLDQMCIVQSWYMPCDFHFFLVTLGVIWLLRRRSSPLLAFSYLALLLVASILVPFLVTYYLELPATLLFNEDFLRNPRGSRMFQMSYIKSHMRASSYLVGFIAGYILVKHLRPGNKVFSVKTSIIGLTVALVMVMGIMSTRIIFYNPHKSYDALEAAFYASLHRPVWAAAISLLILCCALGEVPPLTTMLGWSAWTPMGRLVYGAYLAHMAVQYRDMGIARTAKFLDIPSIIGLMAGDVFYAFSASFIIYLIVEHPTRQLTNALLSLTLRKSEETVYSTEPYKETNKDELDSLHNNVVLILNEKKHKMDKAEDPENQTS